MGLETEEACRKQRSKLSVPKASSSYQCLVCLYTSGRNAQCRPEEKLAFFGHFFDSLRRVLGICFSILHCLLLNRPVQ